MRPLVSVCMMTYNHQDFISKTIDSVISQQVNFSYELVIGEDCSTDDTRGKCEEYAKKYPDIIKLLPSDKNLGMQKNFLRTYEACSGDFISILEGDDYWIDDNKLQKQADFLIENKEFVGIGANSYKIEGDKVSDVPLFSKEKIMSKIKTTDFVEKNRLMTLTMMFRNIPMSKKVKELITIAPICDWPLWVYLSQFGLFKMTEDRVAVYRVHVGGVFSSLSHVKKQWNDIATRNIINEITENKYKKEINQLVRNKAYTLLKYQVKYRQFQRLSHTLSLYIKTWA